MMQSNPLPPRQAQMPGQNAQHIQRVLLLSLPTVVGAGEDDVQSFNGHSFHLGIAYIAAILRDGGLTVAILDSYAEARHQCRPITDSAWQELGLTNEQIVERVVAFQPDLIGITIPFSCQHFVAHEIARCIKSILPNVVLVAGGNHVTAVPEQIDRALFDYLVIGEGEYAVRDLIDALNRGAAIKLTGVIGKATLAWDCPSPIANLDALPLPALDLLPLEKLWGGGRRWINMVATRGCVYDCNFCSIHTVMGRAIRRRSVDNVIAEIKHWRARYGIQEIYFEDDNLTTSRQWAKELFRQIAACNFHMRFYVRNGIRADSIDRELLALMKAAGFQGIVIAPESGSQQTLDNIIGKKMKLADCVNAVKLARQAHLHIELFFVIGFPEETWADIRATIDYARYLKKLGANAPWISLASPYPGTRFFQTCAERQLLPANYDFRRCRTEDYQLINPHYSAAELKAFRAAAMAELAVPRSKWRMLHNALELLLTDPAFLWVKLRYKFNL